MASPQLAIAKVSFSAVLLRADPTSCPRTEIDGFLGQLDATVSRCSPPNVQKCKQWIFANLAHSPARLAALAKYLGALAISYKTDLQTSRAARELSSKRKRLHLLYILNDALYEAHLRRQDPSFAANLEQGLPTIVQSAAAFANCPKHTKKLLDLLEIWGQKGYYQPDAIERLRQTVRDGPLSTEGPTDGATNGSVNNNTKSSKDAPFIMPTMHGDATAHWYDLPAANWLPVMEPNSTRPMNPHMIKPLRFASGPPDKRLVKAVQDLLADVDRIYLKERPIDDSSNNGNNEDIDQMGQRVTRDEITGEIVGGETYYGWSRAFCQKMKQRRKTGGKPGGGGAGDRGRSMSRSPSRSISRSLSPSVSRGSSRPAFKRRRISASPNSRRGRSRSRGTSRSRTRSRGYDRSRNQEYSRDRPARRRSRSYSNSRSPSRSPSRSRNRSRPRQRSPYNNNNKDLPQKPNFPPQPPFNAQQQQQGQGFMPDFSQFPVPPPPPPNYTGPWPPPPPPPPGGMGNVNMNMNMNMGMGMGMGMGMPPNWMAQNMPNIGPGGGWPALPLPPQTGQGQPHHQYGGGGGRGRGGQGYGRGGGGGGGGWNGGRGRGW